MGLLTAIGDSAVGLSGLDLGSTRTLIVRTWVGSAGPMLVSRLARPSMGTKLPAVSDQMRHSAVLGERPTVVQTPSTKWLCELTTTSGIAVSVALLED